MIKRISRREKPKSSVSKCLCIIHGQPMFLSVGNEYNKNRFASFFQFFIETCFHLPVELIKGTAHKKLTSDLLKMRKCQEIFLPVVWHTVAGLILNNEFNRMLFTCTCSHLSSYCKVTVDSRNTNNSLRT